MFNASQRQGKETGTQSEQETEKGDGQVIVVISWILFFKFSCCIVMMFVIGIEVVHKSNLTGRIANGIQNENGNNEKGKDLIGEASGVLDESIQVEKGTQEHIEGHPKANPSIKGKKWHVPLFGEFIRDSLEG